MSEIWLARVSDPRQPAERQPRQPSAKAPAQPVTSASSCVASSKSFGGVRVLNDVDLPPGGRRGGRPVGRQRGWKVDPHQDHHRLPPAGPGRDPLRRPACPRPRCPEGARASASRPSTRSVRLAEQLPLWRNIFMGRPIGGRFGFLKVGEMRRVTAELMGTSMWLHVTGPDTRHLGDRAVGRRAPGFGDRPSPPFRGRHHHPRRAHDGTLAQGDGEAPALRGRDPCGRQVVASSSTTTSSTSTRWPTGYVVLDRGRIAGEFPTQRYSLEELMDIMREVASKAPTRSWSGIGRTKARPRWPTDQA